MNITDLLNKITSKDTHNVWESACRIIELSHNRREIEQLFDFLPLIKEKTYGLNLGGGFAPNQRFVDFAIKIIEFHKQNNNCACTLYVEKFKLTNDIIDREIQYDCFDPNQEILKGNVKILEKFYIDERWIDYYLVECLKCEQKFKVDERDYHYTWWGWNKV